SILLLPRLTIHRCYCALVFTRSDHHQHLHPFPTRRSSDLLPYKTITKLKHYPHEKAPVHLCCAHAVRICCVGSEAFPDWHLDKRDRKSTRLNSSHVKISYAVFCLKKKMKKEQEKYQLYT